MYGSGSSQMRLHVCKCICVCVCVYVCASVYVYVCMCVCDVEVMWKNTSMDAFVRIQTMEATSVQLWARHCVFPRLVCVCVHVRVCVCVHVYVQVGGARSMISPGFIVLCFFTVCLH